MGITSSRQVPSQHPTEEVYILVLGLTGSGKSSFINAVAGADLQVGHGQESCTHKVQFTKLFDYQGRKVVLIDTPGFDDTYRNESDVLTDIKLALPKRILQQLIGVIYLHDINRTRMGSNAVRNAEMLRNTVGKEAAGNLVIVTTMWDLINEQLGEERLKELAHKHDFFGDLMEAGASMVKYKRGDSSHDILQAIIDRDRTVTLQPPAIPVDESQSAPENVVQDIPSITIEDGSDAGSEQFILVMGTSGSGRTSLINSITGSNLPVGGGLESCTSEIQLSKPFRLFGRKIVLIDTPGFNNTSQTDSDILMEIAIFLGKAHKKKEQCIGVLYLHDITNIRMGGTAVRNIKMFRKAVGDTAADNVVIVTTKWDLVSPEVGNERHEQLAKDPNFFGSILATGAKMMKYTRANNGRMSTTSTSSSTNVSTIAPTSTSTSPITFIKAIVQKPLTVPLQLPYELVDKRKKFNKTSAGDLLVDDMRKKTAKNKYRYRTL